MRNIRDAIGIGTRAAIYSDPITRKNLEGVATVRRIISIKTVWIDAKAFDEVVAIVRFDSVPNGAETSIEGDCTRTFYIVAT